MSRGFEEVEFASEGAVLRGRFYPPPHCVKAPIVVMAHGFSATISMTADRYAEVFADAGLGVLVDGGHFGLLHHPSPWFDEASTAQRAFLVRVLRP